jgi:DNA (cytosine-5)-methyltransferase 1
MSNEPKLRYIELFGGCGGMSLGLESAGFHRVLGNEASPMAAETFAYNLIPGSRTAPAPSPGLPASWEPHFTFLDPPGTGNELASDRSFRDWRSHVRPGSPFSTNVDEVLMGKAQSDLLVGDAGRLVAALESFKKRHPVMFERRFGDIDLIAGGPPCQSFSLAGRRERDNPRNRLFEAFVSIVELVRPKVVMFENVAGITRPFLDENGGEWHPWHEVCRAFRSAGYLPIPSLVNASHFGVPQSRSRFILICLSEETSLRTQERLIEKAPLAEALRRAASCFQEPNNDKGLIFQAETDFGSGRWPTPLFPIPSSLVTPERSNVGDAIADLLAIERGEFFLQGQYAETLNRILGTPSWVKPPSVPSNHVLRHHEERTRARFRLMRSLANAGFLAKSMSDVQRNQQRAAALLLGKPLLVPRPGGRYGECKRAKALDVAELITSLSSAKNVQKCLDPKKPAPAQLSIPDDSIHWESDRVLTIREMARIQSFPDWFEFRSKETTGGQARSYEVPQYTQVGNAVPPLLARAFGDSIRVFLQRLKRVSERRQGRVPQTK